MPFEEFYDNYPPPGSNHYCDVAYEDETMAAYAIDPTPLIAKPVPVSAGRAMR